MRTLQGFDVDPEALADTLERIAEGIRENGVMIEEVETGHKATTEEASTIELRIQFAARHGFEDVADAIEYDTAPADFDRKWEQYREVDREISERLGLGDTIAGDRDKEALRELYEDGNLTFVGNVPVVTPTDDTFDGKDVDDFRDSMGADE